MIQLTRKGAILEATPAYLQVLQQEFAQRHAILLPKLLERGIIDKILEQISGVQFEERNDNGIARESWLPKSATTAALTFLLNDQVFLRFIEQVTNCKPLTFWEGRVYRFSAGGAHYDNWHNDIEPSEKRLLAISVNLSPQPFEGGELVIRDVESKQVFFEMANTGLGNAVIFRVDQRLKHRVSPLRGENPRTAFAGWFFDATDFYTVMRRPDTALPDASGGSVGPARRT